MEILAQYRPSMEDTMEKTLMRLAPAVLFAGILIYAPCPVSAQSTLFFDNFDSRIPGIGLAGQGGWYQDSLNTAPIILSTTTPLGTVAVDGTIRTGTGAYNGTSYGTVRHALSGPLSSTGISVFSADAYAFSAYRSTASGVGLSSVNTAVSIQAYPYWLGTPAWFFLGPNGGGDFFFGGFDQPVRVEIVVDAGTGTYYQRLTHSGGVYETPHHNITSSEIAQLTEVILFEDYREASYLGVDLDNFIVTTTIPYNICPLYDQTKAVKSGATIPIKIQLCDSLGNNKSASTIVVKATSVNLTSTSTTGAVEDAGNANPDNNFRYDSSLGNTGGYIFNLKTTGLVSGTYKLSFVVGTSPASYFVQFQVK